MNTQDDGRSPVERLLAAYQEAISEIENNPDSEAAVAQASDLARSAQSLLQAAALPRARLALRIMERDGLSIGGLARRLGISKSRADQLIRMARSADVAAVDAPADLAADGQVRLNTTARLLFEAGHLKNLPRAGWLRLGIRQPESVAEHSHRTAVIALVLAALEGADPLRASALALLHDLHETRTGDVPATGRGYVQTADPQRVTADQTVGVPVEVATLFAGLTGEFEAGETAEARVARDADKLDCLLAALEYGQQGYPTELWVASSLEALTTAAGRRLAEQAMEVGPASWWQHLTADG